MSEAPEAPPRRSRGRPRNSPDLRDSILDQAELVFAEAGYNGASTRDIAERAGVAQGLIRYYFGTKRDLFDEVFRRRGGDISRHRHALLDALLADPVKPTVRAIIHAYLLPQWEMKYSGPGGAAFVRLQARLHSEPEEHAMRLRREVYDSSVRRYVDALADVLPHLPCDTISIRMAFMVGTYMFMLNDLGRLGDMTEGHVSDLGKDPMLQHLVTFLAAGVSAS
ncbi:TetR/AcrR family transcriptional regulator [Falsirhodobacter algicola]|uniref:TetR family transcriptional regulator n=1 Tax=Falsirhodobacter algicola TaxID=2692330 RepID=A0A8J8MUN3_9RHOB|nr:TetR/AcrR family transcriptional regulator [Falsirhodobacter algicola]QUS36741.1 TetR family transcriptional regulator [Falsirhodobacter algicola]